MFSQPHIFYKPTTLSIVMLLRRSHALIAFSLLATVSASSHASVLFSTLGPSDTFGTTRVPVTGSGSIFSTFSEADAFTAPFSGQLTQIDVAVTFGFSTQSGDGYIDLELALNNPANNLPLVSSALTLGTIQATSATPSILSLVPATGYTFTANTAYWLILAPHDAATDASWEGATNPAATSTAYMSSTTGGQFVASSNPADAFRISVDAPEPSTWTLLALGTGLGWRAWSRRRVRVLSRAALRP